MSNSEIPEFRITSEISICQDSFLDNVPERLINVEIQIIQNNDNSIKYQDTGTAQKNKKSSRKKYVYSSKLLEKSQWPKLKISGSYVRESRYSRNSKDSQGNTNQYDINKIVLTTSLTQSLQRLSKEEEQKIANQSSQTRPLRYPCFSPYATVNRNIVIPTSDIPIKELPHPLQSKTINESTNPFQSNKVKESYSYRYQNNDADNTFLRLNGYSQNDPFFGTRSNNSNFYTSSFYQPNTNESRIAQRQKNKKSSSPKSPKRQKNSSIPTSSALTTFDNTFNNNDSVAKTMQPQPSVPLIFRTEMRKKTKNDSLNNRPYFTTCQEPLKKRPATYIEMISSTSHII